MGLRERLEARKPQPQPDRRVPEWIRRRQEKEAEARELFGTHRIADRVMDR